RGSALGGMGSSSTKSVVNGLDGRSSARETRRPLGSSVAPPSTIPQRSKSRRVSFIVRVSRIVFLLWPANGHERDRSPEQPSRDRSAPIKGERREPAQLLRKRRIL